MLPNWLFNTLVATAVILVLGGAFGALIYSDIQVDKARQVEEAKQIRNAKFVGGCQALGGQPYASKDLSSGKPSEYKFNTCIKDGKVIPVEVKP